MSVWSSILEIFSLSFNRSASMVYLSSLLPLK